MGEPAEIDIRDAETDLPRLLARVQAGEEITISRAGEPVARLVPVSPPPRLPRKPGAWKGKIVVHDDFDELPEDIAAAFRGECP
jgi:prevent-host-death family protein